MKRFNVTGTCVGHKHYMVDISAKLDKIEKLVEEEQYFTINRARQYGKTTTLFQLDNRLKERGAYFCAKISFEDAGKNAFGSEKAFCEMFLAKVSAALDASNVPKRYANKWLGKGLFAQKVTSFKNLSEHITKMCEGKKVVLTIDEVDKSTSNELFLHFLGMLRAKYLLRQEGKDYTFHSVILAGVMDIKNLKIKLINDGLHSPLVEEGRIINSPWNIAANFDVNMSFVPDEISTMLDDYEASNKSGMDINEVSKELFWHTDGYPFLVSRICKCIDEELDRNWTKKGINSAVQKILKERSVLFDDFSKNLENIKELNNFLYELLILGRHKSFNLSNITVDLAHTYAYIKESERGTAVIGNRMFESFLAGYYVSKNENSGSSRRVSGAIYQDVIQNGSFNMAACLIKFAEHYKEIYTPREEKFFERQGRLLFLSFLAPLLNGQGFFHIETELTDQRRMDLVVNFEKQQFIIELKLWRGEANREKAFEQLLGYIVSKNFKEGYMLTFDFRKRKTHVSEPQWIEKGGYRIYSVIV